MKKVKCVILSAIALVMVLGLSVYASASEPNAIEEQVLAEGIYEGEELQAVAEMLGYEMVTEDGYVLDSISVTLQINEDEADISTDKACSDINR